MAFPSNPTDGETYGDYYWDDANGAWRKYFNADELEGNTYSQVRDDLVPIGSTYMQLPGEDAPGNIYPGTWEHISSNFSGDFLRVDGTDAASFGSAQSDQMQQITGMWRSKSVRTVNGTSTEALSHSNYGSNGANTGGNPGTQVNFDSANSPNARTGDETRPRNETVRIYKRTS